jgi:acyl-CoA thioesterase-1
VKRYRVGSAALLDEDFAVDLALFLPDGVHPTAQAQPLLLEKIWPQLHPLLRR